MFASAPSHLRLVLHGNPVADIPSVLLGDWGDDCLEAVQAYWRDMARGDVPNRAVKVLLVGNGYVGKTTLAYCLKHGRPPEEGETERTHAIELQKTKLVLPKGGTVEVRLWDFGGQERYHAMHRLFVHGGALYMLLWAEETDERPDEERHPVSYWVDMIKNGAPGAEVLLVKNQIDRSDKHGRPPDFEGQDLGWLPQARVSAAKGWYIDELKLSLATLIEKARPHWHYSIPQSWQKVREAIEAWRQSGGEGGKPLRTVSLGHFEQLCAVHGVSHPNVLLSFLHDTGEVYHRAGRFGDSIILDQSWFIDKIYRLFDKRSGVYQSARAQGGELRGAVFRTYWPEDDEADCETYFDFMLQTGMAFELNYDYAKPFAERAIVMPALLPERGAARLSHVLKRWRATDPGESWFRLEYPFLHRGQVERIIVALSELSEGRDWWRDGLMLEDHETDCSLLLNAVPRERHLDVRLRDGRQEEAFARVRGALEKILGQPPTRTLVSHDGNTFVDLRVLDELRADDTHVATVAGRSVRREPYDRFARFARPPQPEQDLVVEKPATKPTRIFISCSPAQRDRAFLPELETELRALKRQFPIDFWHSGQALAGAVVADEIYKRLEAADIVLLLISSDFVASDECFSNEMVLALKKYEEGGGTPVPILLRPQAMWHELPIGRHQALPRGGKAISQWLDRDEAWADVSRGLRALLEGARSR